MSQYLRACTWVTTVDREILCLARRLHRPWLTVAMKALTGLGNATSWTLLSVSLLLMGGTASEYGTRIAVAALMALAVSYPLKRLCCRPRPSAVLMHAFPLAKDPDAFSFPSGHTCAAFSVAMALAFTESLAIPALTLACGIGFSRVYLGAHFPLDVLVGAVMGSALGVCTQLLLL